MKKLTLIFFFLALLTAHNNYAQGLKIKIHNKTGYDLWQVRVSYTFAGMIKKDAVSVVSDCKKMELCNCDSDAARGGIPVYIEGYIKDKKMANFIQQINVPGGVASISQYEFSCCTSRSVITSGEYEFDIFLKEIVTPFSETKGNITSETTEGYYLVWKKHE